VIDPTALFIDLVRVETRLYNLIDARLRPHDMTLGLFQFLQILQRTPGCRVYDIAQEVDITVGATSKAIDRLEARNWCRRAPNPTDRRSSLLYLTPAGDQALANATPTFETAMTDLMSAVPNEALAALADALAQWRPHLESASSRRTQEAAQPNTKRDQ
jgi:DNA-binding MarR family transcriptional regulator